MRQIIRKQHEWLNYTAFGRLALAVFFLFVGIMLVWMQRIDWPVYIVFMLAGANFAYSTNPPKSE